jgi:hypothetical protein
MLILITGHDKSFAMNACAGFERAQSRAAALRNRFSRSGTANPAAEIFVVSGRICGILRTIN